MTGVYRGLWTVYISGRLEKYAASEIAQPLQLFSFPPRKSFQGAMVVDTATSAVHFSRRRAENNIVAPAVLWACPIAESPPGGEHPQPCQLRASTAQGTYRLPPFRSATKETKDSVTLPPHRTSSPHHLHAKQRSAVSLSIAQLLL